MEWKEFEAAAPALARLGRERLERPGVVLVGTVRRDGTARISPVEPLFLDGRLYLGMMWRSTKALDLLRDPRCLVHSIITGKDGTEGEFKLRGRAVDVRDPEERRRYDQAFYEATGWRPSEPYHLFALDLESAAFVVYGEPAKREDLLGLRGESAAVIRDTAGERLIARWPPR